VIDRITVTISPMLIRMKMPALRLLRSLAIFVARASRPCLPHSISGFAGTRAGRPCYALNLSAQ
jgi:hypothetical protein